MVFIVNGMETPLIEVPVASRAEEALWIIDLMETLLHEAGDPDVLEQIGMDFVSLPRGGGV